MNDTSHGDYTTMEGLIINKYEPLIDVYRLISKTYDDIKTIDYISGDDGSDAVEIKYTSKTKAKNAKADIEAIIDDNDEFKGICVERHMTSSTLTVKLPN